mmetsp:Transcript_16127/g.23330  ORF Transcript_16127/g.23330 Transcript_16127/m.23330 type:complete len:246 (+) Transcript_16127:11-748(+)
MSERTKHEKRDSLFVRNISTEASEEAVRSLFEKYGRVVSCALPKDYSTGRHRQFGFITFHSESDAEKALLRTDYKEFFGKNLRVKFASKQKSPPRRSRSSSPRRRKTAESELRDKIEELQKSKNDMIRENEELRHAINDYKSRKEELKKELETYKSQSVAFMPCGHQKVLSAKDKQLIENALETALGKLTLEEKANEGVINQLKARIYTEMQSKFPDTYRCTEKVKTHRHTKECWQVQKLLKKSK